MFTGIVREVGVIGTVKKFPKGRVLFIRMKRLLRRLKKGDSLAVHGCCLTVTRKTPRGVFVDIASETLKKTTLGALRSGARVNLEASMRPADFLGGHFVLGHVDGVGTVRRRWREGESIYLRIAFPKALAPYMVYTGSVAVDGVSLTVAKVFSKSRALDVCLIPHTLHETTFSGLRAGSRINLEADILGKYVLRAMETAAATTRRD